MHAGDQQHPAIGGNTLAAINQLTHASRSEIGVYRHIRPQGHLAQALQGLRQIGQGAFCTGVRIVEMPNHL
jgi:hypothetical protein